jgi:hypothetical protein
MWDLFGPGSSYWVVGVSCGPMWWLRDGDVRCAWYGRPSPFLTSSTDIFSFKATSDHHTRVNLRFGPIVGHGEAWEVREVRGEAS